MKSLVQFVMEPKICLYHIYYCVHSGDFRLNVFPLFMEHSFIYSRFYEYETPNCTKILPDPSDGLSVPILLV